MRIGESTWLRLPPHLQALFRLLPNHGSEEVVAAFPESDHARGNTTPTKSNGAIWGSCGYHEGPIDAGDSGSAARFFYTAKADADDRLGSKHPTVKPLDLIQYLVRLVTPKNGTVLDLFAGTGTTGEAAFREGMSAVLIEREEEYCADIRRRMQLVLSGPDERTRESIKAKNLPYDPGPLFGGIDLEYPPADRVSYGKFAEGGGGSHKRKPIAPKSNDFPCLKEHCYSPIACGAFGYCREHNFDFGDSINECYRDVRERVAKGGPGWGGWPE